MTTLKSEFLNVLTERGFIHQCSDLGALDKQAASGKPCQSAMKAAVLSLPPVQRPKRRR